MEVFKKKQLVVRQFLIGAEYYNALNAMEFAAKHHTGKRKDNVTEEFDHQLSIVLYALSLPNLMFREEVMATIFLHDCREDYSITDQEVRALFSDKKFAKRVCRAVDNMTKEFRGHKRDENALFEAMSNDPIASIAKGCDRIHNFGSMPEVFTIEKQKAYIKEAEELFFPMLKKARRKFSHQVMAYENIKFVLRTQISLIEVTHRAVAK